MIWLFKNHFQRGNSSLEERMSIGPGTAGREMLNGDGVDGEGDWAGESQQVLHWRLLKECPRAGRGCTHQDFRAGAFQCAPCGPRTQLGGGASPGPGPSLPAPGTGPAPRVAAGARAASCTKRKRGMFSKSLGWKSCLKTFLSWSKSYRNVP